MTIALDPRPHLLANTLGHGAGVLIFGIFLALLLSYRPGLRLLGARLSMLAAALALVWNAGSLAALGLGESTATAVRVTAAASFSALSLLPAVLLHVCLLGRGRLLIAGGYILSAAAILLHLAELGGISVVEYHRLGLRLITYGFGALTLASAASLLASRQSGTRPLTSRLLATMSLLLFAISFVHFGGSHAHPVFSSEFVFHHAGIPLSMFVLLQDYRAVLLDAFLRFLATGTLAALTMAAAVSAMARIAPGTRPVDPFREGVLIMAGCAVLLAYSAASGALSNWLRRIAFRQPRIDDAVRRLRQLAAESSDENDYLAKAGVAMAALMGAEPVVCPCGEHLRRYDLVAPTLISDLPRPHPDLGRCGAEVAVPLRLAHGDVQFAMLGPRRGGRRYLSGDLELLARFAARVVEQLESLRESEIQRLVSEAELRALEAQIHPHFLFNAFNTLYGTIPKEAAGARRTVLNLADIFRYFLQRDKSFVPLEEELRIIEAYLEIEALRLGDKLQVEWQVDPDARAQKIPLLSVEPLVENAVKHGVARRPGGGRVRVTATKTEAGVEIAVADTGPGFAATQGGGSKRHAGVGLENVRRRLELCYGPGAGLDISTGPDGTTVRFLAPATRSAESTR
jgi:two-component system, LytTR family, sensor kinase